ncbi:MAG: polysaccharide deacetylase family protein [Arthrobacter sp.]
MPRSLLLPLVLAFSMALGGSTAVAPTHGQHVNAASLLGKDGFARGLVSVTFDDGWVSQYTNALPVLREQGITATNYVTSGCVNVDPACMTQAQIQAFVDRGDEIGSHTVSHPHLTKITAAERNTELQGSQTELRRMFGPSAATNFAAPFGEYDHFTVETAQRYYGSARSTDSGFNTKSGFYRYGLVGQNVLAHTPPEMVQDWIDSAKANNYWLILVYHEVGENRNGGVFHIDTGTFQAEMRAIANSGLETVTVNQGLLEVTRQLRGGES